MSKVSMQLVSFLFLLYRLDTFLNKLCSNQNDNFWKFIWIKHKFILFLAGEDGEGPISQKACTGEIGGTSPITGSAYHVALCGYMNIFSFEKGTCQIDNIPDAWIEN